MRSQLKLSPVTELKSFSATLPPKAAMAGSEGGDEQQHIDLLISKTSEIVIAYIDKNFVPISGLPELIRNTHEALSRGILNHNGRVNLSPAVPVSSSINQDYLVCLEDGKKLKLLKRYIRTKYGLSPEDYRKRWNLPDDYPMICPNYSKERRAIIRARKAVAELNQQPFDHDASQAAEHDE